MKKTTVQKVNEVYQPDELKLSSGFLDIDNSNEAPMPVGYAEQQPAINLSGINEHLQYAFAGIIY